jgi:hypothetical protein
VTVDGDSTTTGKCRAPAFSRGADTEAHPASSHLTLRPYITAVSAASTSKLATGDLPLPLEPATTVSNTACCSAHQSVQIGSSLHSRCAPKCSAGAHTHALAFWRPTKMLSPLLPHGRANFRCLVASVAASLASVSHWNNRALSDKEILIPCTSARSGS